MDVTRLSEVLGWMRADEGKYKLQPKLIAVQESLRNLSTNPGDQNHQLELTSALESLESKLVAVMAEYDPAQRSRIDEVGGAPFFTSNMVDRIRAQISQNPMSPASALEEVDELVKEREEFINRVESTEEGVDEFVEYSSGLRPGNAALGFELPRTLFDNEFKDFIAELRALQRILRVFSEIEMGSATEIKLGKISSSNPLIFLEVPPIIAVSIAASVSWVLSQWKKFEEIRKIRAETAKLGSFNKEELEDFFDKKINESLDRAVVQRTEELLASSNINPTRKQELDSELGWALKALFARIERGMRVEVEVKAIQIKEGEELTETDQKVQEAIIRAAALSEELIFPTIETDPILSLPRSTDNESPKSETKRSQPKPKVNE